MMLPHYCSVNMLRSLLMEDEKYIEHILDDVAVMRSPEPFGSDEEGNGLRLR